MDDFYYYTELEEMALIGDIDPMPDGGFRNPVTGEEFDRNGYKKVERNGYKKEESNESN